MPWLISQLINYRIIKHNIRHAFSNSTFTSEHMKESMFAHTRQDLRHALLQCIRPVVRELIQPLATTFYPANIYVLHKCYTVFSEPLQLAQAAPIQQSKIRFKRMQAPRNQTLGGEWAPTACELNRHWILLSWAKRRGECNICERNVYSKWNIYIIHCCANFKPRKTIAPYAT